MLFCVSLKAAQKGTVTADESYIYVDADFDAKIFSTVHKGEVFEISQQRKGPFYKIRLSDKRIGWISSLDVKAGIHKNLKFSEKKETKNDKPLESFTDEQKELNRFSTLRYQGPRLEIFDWREKTLGHKRHDKLNFFGWSWTGESTVVQAPLFADSSVLVATQPPKYYKKVTGEPASGFAVKAQSSFLTAKPIGEDFLYYYGVGAEFTLSHFTAGVPEGGAVKKYSLDDATIGLIIPIGLGFRIGPVTPQFFYRYYIEKISTSGVSLSLTWQY